MYMYIYINLNIPRVLFMDAHLHGALYKAMVLKFEQAAESSGGFVKTTGGWDPFQGFHLSTVGVGPGNFHF